MAERKRRPQKTRAQQKLAKASYTQLKRATPAQSVAMGRTALARPYILASVTRVTKSTLSISARQYEKRKAAALHGMTPEGATEARRRGAISYISADQRARVAKARATRRVNARIGKGAGEAATKHKFRSKGQTRAVLDYLEEQFAAHERFLAGQRPELPEAEYRKTVELAFRYLPDDDRTRDMRLSFRVAVAA